VKPKSLRVGIRIQKSQNAIPCGTTRERSGNKAATSAAAKAYPKVAQPDSRDEQHASGNARAGDRGTEVGLKNNQPREKPE
jgi:hypothetical protein